MAEQEKTSRLGGSRTATLVGLFLFLGLVAAGWLILQFGSFGSHYDEAYQIEVCFDDASGIIVGTPVRLGGVKIGEVTDPPMLESVNPPKVRVPLRLNNAYRLPVDAIFDIQSTTVLGDKLIIATIPEGGSNVLLADGAMVEGGVLGGLGAIQNDAVELARDTRELLGEAHSSLSQFDSTLESFHRVAVGLESTINRLDSTIFTEESLTSLDRSLSQLADTSATIHNASTQLQPLFTETRKTLDSIGEITTRAEETFAGIDKQIAKIAPSIEEVPLAMKSLRTAADQANVTLGEAEETFAQANETLGHLNQDDGLLNTLTDDTEAADNTKSFLRNLRRHGVLGYRDEETPEKDPRERFKGRRR